MRAAVRLLLTLFLAAGSAGYLGAEGRAPLADRAGPGGPSASARAAPAALVVEGAVGADGRASEASPPSAPTAPAAPSPAIEPTATATATVQPAPPPVTVVVTVIHDARTDTVTTTASTVGTMLTAQGIPVHSLDKVTPPLASPLTGGATVRIIRVTQTTSAQRVTVPFRSVTKSSPKVEIGSQTVTPGANGTLEKDFRTTYYDGKAVGTVLAATKVIVPERDQVTLIGTGQPAFVSHGHSQDGAASWYGVSGLTAASPSLPFGTVVHVTDLANGRTINVRIEDRGPSAGGGRILDLSELAFSQLAPPGAGVIQVKLQW